jgi:hypothetical protein
MIRVLAAAAKSLSIVTVKSADKNEVKIGRAAERH